MHTYQKLKRLAWGLALASSALVVWGYYCSVLHSLLFLLIIAELAGGSIGIAIMARDERKEFEANNRRVASAK